MNIMSRKQYKEIIEQLKYERDSLMTDNRRLNYNLDRAELLNATLIDNLGNNDTTVFIYNGDTYGIEEITYNKNAESVDTLSVEMVKKDFKVEPRQGGLIDSLSRVANDIGSQLNKILYGDKKD